MSPAIMELNTTQANGDADRSREEQSLTFLQMHNVPLSPGGADTVLDNEAEMLRLHGHRVVRYTISNDELAGMSKRQILQSALWNRRAVREVREMIAAQRPDVVHVHNTFPIMSPAVLRAAHQCGVPVLMTLHSYRLSCLNGLLYREGAICEKCVGKTLSLPGIARGCYKESRLASSVIAGALALHRTIGTYRRHVDAYLALSPFARQVLVRSGYPAERIHIKPNFVHPAAGQSDGGGGYALFVGRLTPEKGAATVIRAWRKIGSRLPIKFVGDGPLRGELQREAATADGVEFLGWKSKDEVADLLQRAKVVVFPSQWYEGLPMVILEAFSAGVPVVASDVGNFTDVIRPQATGLHFRTGDADDLAAQIEWLLANPTEFAAMGRQCHAEYLEKYCPEANYALYMQIVRQACQSRSHTQSAQSNT
ncbi:MAG: glycosyltransferase family 4 protein [Planctomycetales bacterium]|nr:glycosyltransferase family 4 protein [Planctomycetales bacterium]